MTHIKKRLAYFVFILFLITFFVIFFFLIASNTYIDNTDCIVNITFTGTEKTVHCSGFVSENVVYTVAHLFEYENMNIYKYEKMNNGKFYHIPKGLSIYNQTSTYVPIFIYCDNLLDIALISLSANYEYIPISEYLHNNNSFYAPISINKKYDLINRKINNSLNTQTYFQLDYLAVNGLSGSPIFNSLGYVSGIICSINKKNGVTNIISSNKLIDTKNNMERLLNYNTLIR